jgi:hypothetical protein
VRSTDEGGATDDLQFLDQTSIKLGSSTYRWLNLKRFSLGTDMADADAISALVRHVRYRDTYCAPADLWEPAEDIHGPYWLHRITVEAFKPTTRDSAKAVIAEWADEYGQPGEVNLTALADAADAVFDVASAVFELADLRAWAQHEWGFVLGDFHEFVTLDRARHTLTLMVASED